MKDSATSITAMGSLIMNEPFSFPQYTVGTQSISRRQPQQTHVMCSAAMPVIRDLPQTVCRQQTMNMSEWKNMNGLHGRHSWTHLEKNWETEEKGLNLSDSRWG